MTASLAPAPPPLVALARRDAHGPAEGVLLHLLDGVRRLLPSVEVKPSLLSEPELDDLGGRTLERVIDEVRAPSVLVALLLGAGRQVSRLPQAAALSPYGVAVANPLDPDRLLARALSVRLRQAGAVWGDAVVLAAAHCSAPDAMTAAEEEAAMLASEWGSTVSVACASTGTPSVEDAVAELRDSGADRVFVAPYMLTPGRVAQQVARSASAAGAIGVGDVLGGHSLLVELVVQRYRAAVSGPCH